MLNNALWAPVLEYLEPRLLLSGAIESAELVSIDWYGQTIQAHADEWIVRLDDGIAGKQYTSLLESELVEKGIAAGSLASIGQSQFGLLRAPGLSIKQVNAWAGKYSGVLYAEPNFVYSISSGVTPNDPALTNGSLWGLNNTGQSGGTADADIDAPEAWSITTGSSDVVIGVIDTGVDYTHADLVGNMWVNPGETVGDGIDNDANGYIDDVYGWDFVNNDNDPMDGHGHGTHVSGTIGGVGDDGSGIVGVNWDVSIMALKFLDDSGSGSTGDAIAAIDYATMMRQYYGINVVATNNSWGGGMYSSALLDAIETAGQEGILFVAAAGNESQNNDVVTHYPSDYNSQYILSVAATDRDDELASFSNYGAVAVDLAAPGVSIYSSVPGNGYASYNGTSMAAPHVAGVVALLAASQPDAAAGEIRDAILAGVDPIANLTGLTATGGRLNAYSSLLMLGTFGPRVMSVNPSGFAAPVDEINIHFSENLLASSVVGANFMLRNNGPDDTFDTADDNVFTITNLNVSLVAGNRVSISLATDLPLEDYRVTVAGTGANPVRDADNNALNEGVDHEHFFTIVSPYGANEHNDKMSDATDSGLVGIGEVSFSGEIGDGLWGYDDVDLFVFQANEPGTFVAETDTTVLGSDLDTVLRLFDSDGNELDWNDDWDFPDSRIEYELETAGTYYLGVSSYSNYDYDPRIEDGWYGDSIGGYYLTMKLLGRPEIHGSKWSDANANGVRDEGEAGLAGWTIFLDTDVDGVLDPGELSTITDAEGNYSFVDLNAGTYVVAEIPKARWQQTYPLSVDADSYVGITSELQFEDIRYTGQPVLFNTDDESHYLSPADLGGFEFPLYGVNYDEVYISTNGLITFEDEATSWFNGDLSLYPQGAAIAVLWDDLELRSAIGGAVYWELQGWYAEERLIIQWQNAEFVEAYDYDENYTDLVTFQAILGADGSITLSYSDLDTDG
ncbi:MAG: S8 family serine peptidase, partial [Phycisphaerales bacterium]|nr:S8 family serine peptidase [Phycisphaerales bacterium]